MGLDPAMQWGVLAFVLNLIAFSGSFVATILSTVLALIQFESIQTALLVFLRLNAIQFLIGSYLEPRLAGAAVAISPFMVLFAVFFFGLLWGFFGAFIGVPMLIAGATLLAQRDSTRWIATLVTGLPKPGPSSAPDTHHADPALKSPAPLVKTRHALLIAITRLALALLLPAMPQPLACHDFADKRESYGIENFLDVVSNFTFTRARLAGLVIVLRRRTCFENPAERWPYLVFAIGVLLTGAGSCYYHLQPNNETLFWDRLPMTISLMALISAPIVDRVDARTGLIALVPMVLVGMLTAVYWIVTERLGRGNVMPYGVLQAWALVVLVKLVVFHPSRYTHGSLI